MKQPFGRWALTHLATAALLVLALVGGLAALWQPPPANDHDPTHVPALVHALASVPGNVVAEVLLEATFPHDELPAGDAEAIFYRFTLPRGARLPYLLGPYYGHRADLATSGVGAEVVQSGAYSLRLNAPIRVQRNGGSVEGIPARTEVMLGPGDTVSYPDYTEGGTIHNTGDEPAVIVGVAIVGTERSGMPPPKLPATVTVQTMALAGPADWRGLPAAPVTVSLWRLTLPAGASVGPYDAMRLEVLHVESGVIQRSFVRPGETVPRSHPLVQTAGSATGFMILPSGVQPMIASAGDEPARFLALSVEPDGAWSGPLDP